MDPGRQQLAEQSRCILGSCRFIAHASEIMFCKAIQPARADTSLHSIMSWVNDNRRVFVRPYLHRLLSATTLARKYGSRKKLRPREWRADPGCHCEFYTGRGRPALDETLSSRSAKRRGDLPMVRTVKGIATALKRLAMTAWVHGTVRICSFLLGALATPGSSPGACAAIPRWCARSRASPSRCGPRDDRRFHPGRVGRGTM